MKNREAPESAKNSVAKCYIRRRAENKEYTRMAEYFDPMYAAGMEKLFGGAIEPPKRGSSKRHWF